MEGDNAVAMEGTFKILYLVAAGGVGLIVPCVAVAGSGAEGG